MPGIRQAMTSLAAWLVSPVDAASMVAFRFVFGLIVAYLGTDYIVVGRVEALYVNPAFHFTYYGFDWVQPFPSGAMTLFFATMSLLGLAVAVGFLYRFTAPLLALALTYFFLLDRTNYQNHYYLLTLLAWVMAVVPANRLWSFDAFDRPALRSETCPAWSLLLVRFHVGLPYFFGGVAKLESDWFAGAPFRQMLASRSDLPLIGPLLTQEPVVQAFIWGGMLFDLSIVPLLLWRRTRTYAYVACLSFHLTNAVIFDSIHIFPWFMILATTIFFCPDWPRRFFGRSARGMSEPTQVSAGPVSAKTRLGLAALLMYCGFHLIWPLAHFAEGGQTSWTERRHHFSWRMMLRGKTSGFRYFVTDPQTGETWSPNVRNWISADQEIRFVRDPEMILHLAHFLADKHYQLTGRSFEVRALVLTSLNGRKPQLLIDPMIDLAKEPRGFYSRAWIQPLTEPLPKEPWMVPLAEWERHIELPPLPFALRQHSAASNSQVQSFDSASDVSSKGSSAPSAQR